MLTPNQTDKLIHYTATLFYSVLLLVSALLLWYTKVALAGDEGDTWTDLAGWVVVRQNSALGLIGAAATAVPAIALGLANTAAGKTTRRGWIYIGILGATWLLATLANFLLDPKDVNLGGEDMPALADATALSISGFSMTYVAAILGLKRVTADAAKPGAAGGKPPPAATPGTPPAAGGGG